MSDSDKKLKRDDDDEYTMRFECECSYCHAKPPTPWMVTAEDRATCREFARDYCRLWIRIHAKYCVEMQKL